jgi:putative endonuclease
MKNHVVYVIRSLSNNRLYIGQTDNFERRFSEHQRGKNISTQNQGPWELVNLLHFDTRKEALLMERKLKGMKRPDRVLKYIEKLALRSNC